MADTKKIFTVKEIADVCKVSKPTVRRNMHKLADNFVKENSFTEDNTLYLTEELAVALIGFINEKIDITSEEKKAERERLEVLMDALQNVPKRSNCVPENVSGILGHDVEHRVEQDCFLENEAERTGIPVAQDWNNGGKLVEQYVEHLSEQLREKDKQIAELTAALNTALNTTAIQAKQLQQLQDSQSKTIEEQTNNNKEERKGFFKWLFKKK